MSEMSHEVIERVHEDRRTKVSEIFNIVVISKLGKILHE